MPAKDVTASVRRAFAAKRLQSAWSMLGSSQVGDRSAAIEGVARLLETEGLTLDDVLTTILSVPIGPYRRGGANATAHDDLFTHAARRDGTPPAPSAMRVVSGRNIPERIGGRVVLLDDRNTRKGPELVVAIVGFDVRYDPLAARCELAIAALRMAAEKGGLTQIVVTPPASARQMPLVEKVGMGIVF
jgi:hypothetical protein